MLQEKNTTTSIHTYLIYFSTYIGVFVGIRIGRYEMDPKRPQEDLVLSRKLLHGQAQI